VAFVRKLPGMTPEQYKALGGGEDNGEHHHEDHADQHEHGDADQHGPAHGKR